MNRDELAALILTELHRRCEAIRKRVKPPPWRTWEVRDHADDMEYGPLYSPGWFGEHGATEARRVRLLRTVYRLDAAGLVDIVKSEGGRLERLRLTKAGRAAVAEMRSPETEIPA